MSSVAKVGDTYMGMCTHGDECCPHSISGTIIQGSNNSNCNKSNIARLGDSTKHTGCPHCSSGKISSCKSSSVKVNGIAIATAGDIVSYSGGQSSIISNNNVNSN